MKPEEKVVETYLKSQIDLQVIHEPYKKQTPNLPDFELKGTIGIEVRRLNHNILMKDNTLLGLEDLQFWVLNKLHNLFDSFGVGDGEFWYVDVDFKRPIRDTTKLLKQVEVKLREFFNDTERHPKTIVISPNLKLELNPCSIKRESFFTLCGFEDEDWDGWYLSTVIRNLNWTITEKEDKVRRVIHRYGEWWLVLVDYILHGSITFDEYERETILNQIPKSDVFKKIIIIEKSLTKDPFIIEW
jgi:hypothetical protein